MLTRNVNKIHSSWQPLIATALATMPQDYLQDLCEHPNWLPGPDNIFNAFSLPLSQTRYILFGESPYPRAQSANGYAFWDAAVNEIWSPTGFSKPVNRATSLRNFLKMLLLVRGDLAPSDLSQPAIASLPKHQYIQTLESLFKNMHHHGFLLLNTCLVLGQQSVAKEAKNWQPFMQSLLIQLSQLPQRPTLILWGNISQKLNKVDSIQHFKTLQSEHPYNISFIQNKTMAQLFAPLDLLVKN